jgi:hypothetical protein
MLLQAPEAVAEHTIGRPAANRNQLINVWGVAHDRA